ncbi:hypothetical protein BGZ98_004067 [Dissophora globulifera]|nr:hypothetical protein BGZ98_004067 [Dissophora globulifera]
MPAANIPPLTTSTPSALEVNFRRLMAKSDATARSSDKILQGADRTRYIMHIKVLKEMLADLEDELKTSGKADITVLKEYAEKIESLAGAVDGQTPTHSDHHSHGSGTSPSAGADASGLRERRPVKELGSSQHSGLRISDARDAAKDLSHVEAALQNDRAQREEMEAGLSMLMQQLRHNAMAIQQTLVDEKASGLLDDADQALDKNISRLGKERTRLELYSKQSRKTKWMIWGVVLGVSVVFVFMFFIIRIF